jgi:hypothetical protein
VLAPQNSKALVAIALFMKIPADLALNETYLQALKTSWGID